MMYPFMTLTDGTGIAHSDAYDSNGVETVKVYIDVYKRQLLGHPLQTVIKLLVHMDAVRCHVMPVRPQRN